MTLFTVRVLLSSEMMYLTGFSVGFWSFTVHLISPATDTGRSHFNTIFCSGYHFSAVDRFFCSESKVHKPYFNFFLIFNMGLLVLSTFLQAILMLITNQHFVSNRL